MCGVIHIGALCVFVVSVGAFLGCAVDCGDDTLLLRVNLAVSGVVVVSIAGG
jgi:hypothetical protein